MKTRMVTAAVAALAACAAVADSTVWLDELDLADMSTGWGEPRRKRSVNGKNLMVGDKEFARGVGTHALSSYEVDCGGKAEVSTWGENVGGHCWRTTGDITDTWRSMSGILEAQAELWPYARPGAWNDPDMLVLGPLGWGNIHPTRLTPNEQYTHMSFWCILCSPLLIGCDLTRIDDFTMSLLTNDEVLETNQDPLGAAAARVAQDGTREVWAKPMSDGSLVFALYNRGPRDERISVDFAALGLEGQWRVRDLWRQKNLGTFSGEYAEEVWPHATTLVRQGGRGVVPRAREEAARGDCAALLER